MYLLQKLFCIVEQKASNFLKSEGFRSGTNYNQLKEQIKTQQEQKKRTPSTVQDVLNILSSAVKAPAKYLKDVALRRAKEWINELIRSTKYIGVLRKKFENGLIEMTQLNMEQNHKIWEYVIEFLNLKSTGKSVTLFS